MNEVKLDLWKDAANLPHRVADMQNGDTIILCQDGKPIAMIHPLPKPPSGPRPIGLGTGLVEVPDSFFDSLPEELLDLFEGKGSFRVYSAPVAW